MHRDGARTYDTINRRSHEKYPYLWQDIEVNAIIIGGLSV